MISSLSLNSVLSPPVFAELQQADLITGEECEELYYPRHVVQVQRGKSPEVHAKTADVLRRHGFVEESNLLIGKQTQPLIHVPVVYCQGQIQGGGGGLEGLQPPFLY